MTTDAICFYPNGVHSNLSMVYSSLGPEELTMAITYRDEYHVSLSSHLNIRSGLLESPFILPISVASLRGRVWVDLT